MIRAWWHYCDNFGDALTPYLIKKISGQDVVYADPGKDDKDLYMVTGSILGTMHAKNCIIWGNGIAFKNERIYQARKWAAVRGPLSQARIAECGFTPPTVAADPAILLPKYYQPKITAKRYALGFMPSCIDYPFIKQWFTHPSIKVIDMINRVETVIDEMVQCERILSSSLHGLITAAAYNIPVRWARHSQRIIGDGTKYHDFLLSIGMQPYAPTVIEGPIDSEKIISQPFIHEVPEQLGKDLLAACPFGITT